MNFLFACGGTAGHINPAVGVAGRLRELMPDSRILFIGADGKMETELVPEEGYEIRTIPMNNLSRSLTPEGVAHNLGALRGLAVSLPMCRRILREFQPDAVIGTGGYVCFPVLREASRMGIPTAVHESNAEPGLTTKLLERRVDRIMVGFEEARNNYKDPSKVCVTGTPVRLDFLRGDKLRARQELGIPEDVPLVLSVWGSLGATQMNLKVADMIALAMHDRPFRLIHSAGKRGIKSMCAYMSDTLGLEDWDAAGFEIRDYIHDMPRLMAAADLVLCRSGASTLAELTALGRPSVLVPSPNVVHNHQEANARVLEHAGGAKVLLESEATPEAMYAAVTQLLGDRAALDAMSESLHALAANNPTDEITSLVLSLVKK